VRLPTFRWTRRSVAQSPAVALYLDLMKRSLTNWVYGDFESPPFSPDARREGNDWPPFAHTMTGLKRLDNLQFCVEDVLTRNVPGDLIETGVWRGGATIFMKAILRAYGVQDRNVWVADSFQGLPPPNVELYPADQGADLTVYKELAIPLDEVRANFERYGLLDDHVRFLKGWFRDTLEHAPIQQLAVMRLDGDLYESTMDGLRYLYPKLAVGGYVIIDDYGCMACCRQAVQDYRRTHNIHDPITAIDWTGVYWQRTTPQRGFRGVRRPWLVTSFNPEEYGLALETPQRLTDMSPWHMHIPFAFALIQMVRPKCLVELGTHKGDSYSAFCQAVMTLGLETRCYAVDSWDGDIHTNQYDASVYEELKAYHDAHYGSFSTLIRSLFDDALDHFADGTIDLLHIDGTHTYDAVRHDFELWLPKMSRTGIVILHDIAEHQQDFGVWRWWKELKNRYTTFEFLFGHGLGVVAVGDNIPDQMRMFFADQQHAPATEHYFSMLGQRVASLGEQHRLPGRQPADVEPDVRHGHDYLVAAKRAVGHTVPPFPRGVDTTAGHRVATGSPGWKAPTLEDRYRDLLTKHQQLQLYLTEQLETVENSVLFREMDRNVEELKATVQERTAWAQGLDAELTRARAVIAELGALVQERTAWAQGLDAELVHARAVIAGLEALVQERTAWAQGLDAELVHARAVISKPQ